MAYCSHIRTGIAQSSLFRLNKFQKYLRGQVVVVMAEGRQISHTAASFPHRCCKPIATLSLFPWQMFRSLPVFSPARVLQLGCAMLLPRSQITFISPVFQISEESSTQFFPLRIVTLRKRHPRRCFPEHDNFNLINSRVNRYVSSLSLKSALSTAFFHVTHLIHHSHLETVW